MPMPRGTPLRFRTARDTASRGRWLGCAELSSCFYWHFLGTCFRRETATFRVNHQDRAAWPDFCATSSRSCFIAAIAVSRELGARSRGVARAVSQDIIRAARGSKPETEGSGHPERPGRCRPFLEHVCHVSGATEERKARHSSRPRRGAWQRGRQRRRGAGIECGAGHCRDTRKVEGLQPSRSRQLARARDAEGSRQAAPGGSVTT